MLAIEWNNPFTIALEKIHDQNKIFKDSNHFINNTE